MARHVWSVLCQKASVDKDTGVVSLLQIVEDVGLASLPPELKPGESFAVPTSADLVSFWVRSDPTIPEGAQGRFRLLAPGGVELAESPPFDINLNERPRSRSIGRIPMLVLTGSGRHSYIVELRNEPAAEWVQVADIPVDVRVGASQAEAKLPPP